MNYQQSLFAKPVSLKISFEDLLGSRAAEFNEVLRRERWEQWKNIASKQKRSLHVLRAWTDVSACSEGGTICVHLRGDWCNLQGLPATVNPILSFRSGMIGMACMGAGYEKPELSTSTDKGGR